MADAINVGDVRRLLVTNIKNAAGTPTDPTTLKLYIRKPETGAAVVYTYPTDTIIVKDTGTGNYHADVPLDAAGPWRYDWVGTGAATFAEGGEFYVWPLNTSGVV